METANALPAIERPPAQPIEPLPIGEDWPTYEQPLLGISFRYPPEWEIEDPFNHPNMDESKVLNTALTLHLKGEPGERQFSVLLSPYTISDTTPLTNWVAINDQRNRNPQNSYLAYNMSIPPDVSYLPRQARDLVHIQQTYGNSQSNWLWVSIDNLVYSFLVNPTALAALGAVLSTLEFDEEQVTKLYAEAPFLGDERQMVREMVNSWVTPTIAPHPTPTPTVRATVTPSAFESPLIGGLKRYVGNAQYPELPTYEIRYDPATWELTVVGDSNNQRELLAHRTLLGCEINLDSWVTHVIPLAAILLAGQQWGISLFPTTAGDFLTYYVDWGNGGYTFNITLPAPIPDPYDATKKSQCKLDAEAVLATFYAAKATPTPTILPSRQGMLMPP
jgi:hypothetical protein